MKILLILITTLFLTSCSTTKEIQIVYIEEKRNIIQPKKPDELILSDITFEKEFYNLNNIFYLLMSDKNYKELILNLEKIKKYINEQKDIIDYYEKETKTIDNTKLTDNK